MMVQWLGIHLPMQGTQIRLQVQEDPTCQGATHLCTATTEAYQSSCQCSEKRRATSTRSLNTTRKSRPGSTQLEKAQQSN